MVLLFTDLDGTLIRSYRRKFDDDVICVERHRDREFSFISSKKLELLHNLIKNDNVLVIPITTRSEAEYRRIKIPDESFKYALIDNGARLLVDGEIDEEWEKAGYKYFYDAEESEIAECCEANNYEFLEDGTFYC